MPLPEGTALSASACDAREAEELRAHLLTERRRATTWNRVWRWSFTAAAVGSFGVGLANPFPSLQDGLYVSAGKAAVGAAARWIIPLRVDVPEPNADTCADLAALRKAIRETAKKEKGLFVMGHIGGLALNLAGGAILWYRGSFWDAALSVGVGYPVGLLSNYTMPRSSWHLDRERAWTIAITPAPDGTGWFAHASGAF
ncbi:MAG: hypothetical protein HOV81_02600 [Kofleriaceae bacterium]|nr:hypothetical protein [Kofleriaceae bacterium]